MDARWEPEEESRSRMAWERTVEEGEAALEAAILPLRDTVVFPRMVTPLNVGRDKSLRAVEAAVQREEPLVVVTQRDEAVEDPAPEDLYTMGTLVSVARVLRMPDGTTSVLVQGQQRAQILEFIQREPYLRARIRLISERTDRPPATEALMRAVLSQFERVVQLDRTVPEDAYVFAVNIDEPGWLADLIASTLNLKTAERQELLEIVEPSARLLRLSILLARLLDVLELESKIQAQVQQEVDRTQREFYLREQMKAIQHELGEADVYMQEINELRERLEAKNLPEEVRARAEKELHRLAQMPPLSPEVSIVRTYIDWILELPWTEETEDNLDIAHAAAVLERHHYGLKKAKERILEFLAVRKLAGERSRSPILCFVGPPGTGKTSLGKAIAEALGRRFVRVSLGGIHDEAEIRGHRRTYIGALPGRIIQGMARAGTINPVFMLDEIDKIGVDFRGDPAAALLEVLDPEQNHAFSDHYLEIPYNLSKVLFITTANILDTVPPALRDRLEVIEFPGYTEGEKVQIARRFLIPRQLEENGLQNIPLKITDAALRRIIREYTSEAGVRNLEREIAAICRKTARLVAEGRPYRPVVTAAALERHLGPPRYDYGRAEETDQVGVAMALAWTEAGGEVMPVEVTLMDGKGVLLLTGQLGEVMQESAQAAMSYLRSRARQFGIRPKRFEKTDVHVHVPEGAIPKDGPSAGITIATALVSAFTGIPVRRDTAMTGEITLRGRVLPIGGLKEKVLAAHRAGIKRVILPKKNQRDLMELPRREIRGMTLIFVETMDEVLQAALARPLPGLARTTSAAKRRAGR